MVVPGAAATGVCKKWQTLISSSKGERGHLLAQEEAVSVSSARGSKSECSTAHRTE